MIKKILLLVIAGLLFFGATPARAQDPTETPSVTPTPVPGPIYIVQSGDSLTLIASRFGVSLADLMSANALSDANQLFVGQQLTIPGLTGISGYLITDTIQYGDTLRSMSRRHETPADLLQRLNKITSPSELYVGSGLVLPKPSQNAGALTQHISLGTGDTLLEAAVRSNSDIWTITDLNSLPGTWDAIPSDALYLPSTTGADNTDNTATGLPPALHKVDLRELPFVQGKVAEIKVSTDPDVQLTGTLVGKPLHFFPDKDGTQVALQGVDTLLDPGPYPLRLEATLPDGSKQAFEQNVLVASGFYPQDPMLIVPPETVDPAVTQPEFEQVLSLVTPATPTQYWSGTFANPSAYPDCFSSRFGNRRAYNGGPYDSFHSGLDFCGGEGLPIYAPADGVVVFAGPLTVRGNATIIDHGWGIYTGYWHQSEILVKAGDHVTKGQQIGVVGGTGRVTGAHLHWEVWANGVQVDPMDWLNYIYP